MKKPLLAILGIIFAISSSELALRMFSSPFYDEKVDFLQREYEALNVQIKDDKLGFKYESQNLFDVNGFRNNNVPPSADIITIGDSQTWGINVLRDNNWPSELERLSNKKVYNMSIGGYGPAQYYELFNEALKYKPDTILIALYLGNDLYDTYRYVYSLDHYNYLRNKNINNEIYKDNIDKESVKITNSYKQIVRKYKHDSPYLFELFRSSAVLQYIPKYFGQKCNDYNYKYGVDKYWAENTLDGFYFDNKKVCTVFKPQTRILALDLDDLRIKEGLRITKLLLKKIQLESTKKNINFRLIIIPTKENVFTNLINSYPNTNWPTYNRLIEMENVVLEQITKFSIDNGIKLIHLLPELKREALTNVQLYPKYIDGHPNHNGYKLIASIVHRNISSK